MMQVESDREWPRWLPSFGLVVLLHVTVWWGYTHFKSELIPPRPLPVVQVSLIAPPAPLEPKVVPLQPPPPKVERQPKPVVKKAVSAPTPVPVMQPVVEHAQQQAPVAIAQPSPPVPSPPAPPAPEPVLELPRYNAAYLSNPPPAYPLAARRRGIEGTVLVRAEISAGGECQRAELKKTSGHEMLDHAALEAVKKWRFMPAKRGSQAVVAWVEVPITFKLENN
ncbi:energy transducer TonB [Sulfuricella sp. T08]|uniref:energy transducer TonB n=1 Tax=Sulfuricella sp. T08 TaxID=1632857 RepID=UPI00061795F1|nr:energy transducer TonB [Sulfuricella sp. T08]GAO36696.1 energy transducer TonB [Sulfuricella sp. T08]